MLPPYKAFQLGSRHPYYESTWCKFVARIKCKVLSGVTFETDSEGGAWWPPKVSVYWKSVEWIEYNILPSDVPTYESPTTGLLVCGSILDYDLEMSRLDKIVSNPAQAECWALSYPHKAGVVGCIWVRDPSDWSDQSVYEEHAQYSWCVDEISASATYALDYIGPNDGDKWVAPEPWRLWYVYTGNFEREETSLPTAREVVPGPPPPGKKRSRPRREPGPVPRFPGFPGFPALRRRGGGLPGVGGPASGFSERLVTCNGEVLELPAPAGGHYEPLLH